MSNISQAVYEEAQDALDYAIRACHQLLEETHEDTLELIRECVVVINSYHADRPRMAKTVLGKYLALAAADHRPDAVMVLSDLGADVNWRDRSKDGMTPLQVAVQSGNPNTIRLLANAGADLEAHYGKHASPLHLAVSLQNPEMVTALMQAGSDPNKEDEELNFGTPLHRAVGLLGTKPDVPTTTTTAEKVQRIVHALRLGYNPKGVSDPTIRDGAGELPIEVALERPNAESVATLLLHRAEYSQEDLDWIFKCAVEHNRRVVMKELEKRNADVLQDDGDGNLLARYADVIEVPTRELLASMTTEASVRRTLDAESEVAVSTVNSTARSRPDITPSL
jgi:ankyrin repeat protein